MKISRRLYVMMISVSYMLLMHEQFIAGQ